MYELNWNGSHFFIRFYIFIRADGVQFTISLTAFNSEKKHSEALNLIWKTIIFIRKITLILLSYTQNSKIWKCHLVIKLCI